MAEFSSILRRSYLSIYNWTVFVGWYVFKYYYKFITFLEIKLNKNWFLICVIRFQVLYIALKTLNESGHEHVYDAVEKPLLLAQSAAFMEVIRLGQAYKTFGLC